MVKKISERKEALFRILVFIITGIILGIWRYLIFVLFIIHWFITIFSGKRNKDLAELSEYWNSELYRYFRYLTFVSNERPFPFNNVVRISKFK